MTNCTCNQYRAPKCPEGERLHQADRDAYEEVMTKGERHLTHRSDFTLRELHAAQDTYTEARKAWLDHKSTTDSERFMERVREWERSR